MNFRIGFFYFRWHFYFCGVLIGIDLQLYVTEADMEILTVGNLLIPENRICVIHFICRVWKVSLCKSSPPELTTQCCAWLISHVPLFAAPWTVACQAPLSMGILQARILEWVAMPISRGSSLPWDQTQFSCIAGGFFTI